MSSEIAEDNYSWMNNKNFLPRIYGVDMMAWAELS